MCSIGILCHSGLTDFTWRIARLRRNYHSAEMGVCPPLLTGNHEDMPDIIQVLLHFISILIFITVITNAANE